MSQFPKKTPSPSRTYVACCNKSDFSGYHFRKFHLPEQIVWSWDDEDEKFENSCATASWFFLNRLNYHACVEFVMPWEDYQLLQHEGPTEAIDGTLIGVSELTHGGGNYP